jgi:hypothetical protein
MTNTADSPLMEVFRTFGQASGDSLEATSDEEAAIEDEDDATSEVEPAIEATTPDDTE